MLPPMSPVEYAPTERLRPFVRSIRVIRASATNTQAVLPEPGFVLGFRFSGPAALLETGAARPLAGAGLIGVRTSLRRMKTFGGSGVVVTVFRELGAAQFFDLPMHELFGAVVGLADVTARAEVAEIEERLAEAESDPRRVAIVDEYLCRRLRARSPDPLVAAAISALRSAGGSIRIGPLAKRLGTSQDPLEKRFRRTVGASPKQIASIIRFRRVVAGHARGASLTSLAYEAGYFDQSHLIRDFRSFTGEAPERFLRGTSHC